MGVSQAVLDLEQRAIGQSGEPTLGAAFELLTEQWRHGDRDREVALHLMFLAWYLCTEPSNVTGLDEDIRHLVGSGSLGEIFVEVHDDLHRRMPLDPEFNYVVGWMASQFPWCCGPAGTDSWEETAAQRSDAYQRLAPERFTADLFERRGFYGDYFAHVLRGHP